MADKFRVTKNYTIGLSTIELEMLQALKNAGDRGGFYMAYNAMTGNSEPRDHRSDRQSKRTSRGRRGLWN